LALSSFGLMRSAFIGISYHQRSSGWRFANPILHIANELARRVTLMSFD